MAEYLIQDTSLTAIGEQIRVMDDTTDKYSPKAMADALMISNSEINSQVDLIDQITTALEGKVGGSSGNGFITNKLNWQVIDMTSSSSGSVHTLHTYVSEKTVNRVMIISIDGNGYNSTTQNGTCNTTTTTSLNDYAPSGSVSLDSSLNLSYTNAIGDTQGYVGYYKIYIIFIAEDGCMDTDICVINAVEYYVS